MLWFDDTARNSNLLPVKANGLGAVAVARVARQLGQHEDAGVELAAVLGRLRAALLDLLEDVRQHVAEEDRQDRRRRLVCAETMIVAGAGDAGAQQPLPAVDRADHRRAEHEELHVVVRVRARPEQVVPLVVAHRPVQVLARAVDAGETASRAAGTQGRTSAPSA
jgi:hypothetical protein